MYSKHPQATIFFCLTQDKIGKCTHKTTPLFFYFTDIVDPVLL